MSNCVCVCVHAWQSRRFPATWSGSERWLRYQGWLIWPINRMVPRRRRTQFQSLGLVIVVAFIMFYLLGYAWWGRGKVCPRSPRGEKIEPTKWQLKSDFIKPISAAMMSRMASAGLQECINVRILTGCSGRFSSVFIHFDFGFLESLRHIHRLSTWGDKCRVWCFARISRKRVF